MEAPSGNILPLITSGTVTTFWHDIRLFPQPSSSPSSAASPASPEAASYGGDFAIPTYTSLYSTTPPPPDNLCFFICTRTRSENAGGADGAGPAMKPRSSAFRTRRRRLLMSGKTEFDEAENILWNMGILPQTCVLACGGYAAGGAVGNGNGNGPPSAIDAGGASAGGADDGYSSLFDYAPIQAVEIGSIVREVGDVYGVIPLAAMPVQRPNMGGSEVSYRLIVIAADDPLLIPVASGYNGFGVATVGDEKIAEREELQETVERWAVKCGFANRVDDWDLQEDKDAETILIDAHRVWKLVYPTLRKPSRLGKTATFKRLDRRTSFAARPGSPAEPSRVLELVAKPAEESKISASKAASFSYARSQRPSKLGFSRASTVGGGEVYRSGDFDDGISRNDSLSSFGGSDADLTSPYPLQSPRGGFGDGDGGRRGGLPPASPPMRRTHSEEPLGEGGSSAKSALVRSTTVLSKSKSSRKMSKAMSMIDRKSSDDSGSSGKGGATWFRLAGGKGGAVPRSQSTILERERSNGDDDSGSTGWGKLWGAGAGVGAGAGAGGGGEAEEAGRKGGRSGLFTRSRTSAQLGGSRVGSSGGGAQRGESDLPPYAPFVRRHTHHGEDLSACETVDEDHAYGSGSRGVGFKFANQKGVVKARQPQRAAWMKKALSMKVTSGVHHTHIRDSHHDEKPSEDYSVHSASSYRAKDEDLYGDMNSEDRLFGGMDAPETPAAATVQCFGGAKSISAHRSPNRSPTKISTRSFKAPSAPIGRRASLDSSSQAALEGV